MSLSAPRVIFGVHSISPYSRTDKMPYGILKVIGSANIALSSKIEQLYGGSSKFPWAAEGGTISSEVSAKVKAYPGFLFTLFLGGTVTDNAAEAAGSVSTMLNYKGTSAKHATTGIASVGLKSGSSAHVKFAKYIVKVVSATTVDVYAYADPDFARGTDLTFQNDALKITASPLTIVAATAVEIPGTGLELTGGSGTIGMTADDTAYFSSRPINSGSADVVVGSAVTTLPSFGAVFLAQKRNNAEMFEIEAYNVVASGMPIPLAEFAFSETELKMTLLNDSTLDRVFDIRAVNPTSV